jgi:prepilin-type N-terminal cleavage/methylation domain-containing protein
MNANSFSSIKPLRQRQAGYTLIELSISLAIIAVLLVGTLTGVQRLLRANNANNTISSTQAALTNITKLYAGSSDPDIYNTLTLAQMGVWDNSLVTITTGATPTAKVKNPFNGFITVFANSATIGTGATSVAADGGFWYRLDTIPTDSCASVATSFVNTAAAIYVSSTNTTDGATPTATTARYKAPGSDDSTSNLAAACASAGNVQISLFVPS